MRNDRVLSLVLYVAHSAISFLPCVYSYFHRQQFNIRQFYFITNMPTFGVYVYQLVNRKRGLAETDS